MTPINEKKNKDPFGLNAYAMRVSYGFTKNKETLNIKYMCDMDGVCSSTLIRTFFRFKWY